MIWANPMTTKVYLGRGRPLGDISSMDGLHFVLHKVFPSSFALPVHSAWSDAFSPNRIVQRAIAAQLKLSDAQLARAQWSKARHSVIYEHPGHAARIILDATTSKYENEVNRWQEQLDKALSDLRDLPTTMCDYVKDFKPEQKQKQAEQYLEEVKGWVKSLRPFVEVAEQREKEAQARRYVASSISSSEWNGWRWARR